jgi:hypothetical protein
LIIVRLVEQPARIRGIAIDDLARRTLALT